MKLPKQLPAVDRISDKSASVPAGANVGPSAWWNDLISAIPGVVSGIGSIGSML